MRSQRTRSERTSAKPIRVRRCPLVARGIICFTRSRKNKLDIASINLSNPEEKGKRIRHGSRIFLRRETERFNLIDMKGVIAQTDDGLEPAVAPYLACLGRACFTTAKIGAYQAVLVSLVVDDIIPEMGGTVPEPLNYQSSSLSRGGVKSVRL